MPSGGNFAGGCGCGPDVAACEQPTEPVATVGLCLADGSPIAVTVVRDCDGQVTSEGWLDLTTGAWSAGPPPAGTLACGDSRSIQVSGTFCDLGPDGDVLGLVLVEYQYEADGSIGGVRLVDAVTGETYEPQGTITTCPAGVEQPERDLVTLCDLTDDESGTAAVVPFVRDYARDESGAIVGYSDYTLDGEPYTPVGEVGQCQPPETGSEHCQSQVLCDLAPEGLGAAAAVSGYPFVRTVCDGPDGPVVTDTELDGVTPYEASAEVGLCVPDDPCPSTVTVLRLCDLDPEAEPDADGRICATPFLRHLVHNCNATRTETRNTEPDGVTPYTVRGEVVDCGSEGVPALVEVPWTTVSVEPDPDAEIEGRGWLYRLSPVDDPDLVGTMRVTLTSTANTVCPAELPDVHVHNPSTYVYEPDEVLQQHATFIRVDLLDFDTFEPVTGLVPAPDRLGGTAYWDGATILPTENDGVGELYYDGPPENWQFRVGNTGGGTSCSQLSFAAVSLRAEGCCSCRNDDGDTSPGGPEPCRNATTVLLCDADPECGAGGEPTAADEPDLDPYNNWAPGTEPTWCHVATPGEAAEVWSGGVAEIGPDAACPDSGTGDTHRVVGARLTAGAPGVTGAATVTASVRVENLGPNAAHMGCGRWGLWDAAAGERIAYVAVTSSAPVGHVQTLTVTGQVPAEVLAAGDVVVALDLETYHGPGEKAWRLDEFVWSAEVPEPDCENQFLRTLVTDCETGETISITDTTLGGAPYTPAGTVGQCETTGGGPPEPCRDTSTVLLCDLPAEGADGTPEATDTDPTSYPNSPTLFQCINPVPGGGADLWEGGALVIPADATADGTCNTTVNEQVLRGVAATLQADRPDCDDGTASLTVSARFTNDGPSATAPNYRGGLRIHRVDTGERLGNGVLAQGNLGVPSPPGYVETLTVTASVPAELLAAGLIAVVVDVETFENVVNPGAAWTIDEYTASYAYGQAGCGEQFVRTLVTDCVTGAVVSVSDTTLDGEPYEVTGEVGECAAVTPPQQDCQHCETLTLCDLVPDEEQPGGEVVQVPFLRAICRDCQGATVSVTDTSLNGEPYEVIGDVGRCAAVAAEEGGGRPPCGDAELLHLCDISDDGEMIAEFVRRVVYDCDGQPQSVSDTTLDMATPYEATGTASRCRDEPPCPVAFSTECVAVVERSQAAYDNTSLIGGVPGQCGSVQGPEDAPESGASFGCAAGPYTISSWIVDGEEVIADGAAMTFQGGPCGPGNDNPGMHLNWANLLTNLDPTGAAWVVDNAEGCAWYIRSEGAPTDTVYGPMVVTGDGQTVTDGTWVLGAAQSCAETRYTRVWSQECDGSVSVSWLDQAGEPVDAPEGDLVACGTGCRPGGGSGDGCAQHLLEECRWDDTTGDGEGDTQYVELIGVDGCTGDLTTLGTYTEDLTGPYEPVSPAPGPEAAGRGAAVARGARVHRTVLEPGAAWGLPGGELVQAVTATAAGDGAVVETAAGESALGDGESVSWAVGREGDAGLAGPLTIRSGDSGTVTVAWTTGTRL